MAGISERRFFNQDTRTLKNSTAGCLVQVKFLNRSKDPKYHNRDKIHGDADD